MAAEVENDEWSVDALPARDRAAVISQANPNTPDRLLECLRPAFNEIATMLCRDTFNRYSPTVYSDDKIEDNIKRLVDYVRNAKRGQIQLFVRSFLSRPDSQASQHFLKFCESEYSGENVLWCYHFKKMEHDVKNFKRFAKLFAEGYDMFLKLGAPKWVNISYQTREGIDDLWRRLPDDFKHY